jgi:pimeloyl-ACP methyl ester carboxylesterase
MAVDSSLPIREWMQPIEDAEIFVRAVGGFDGGPVLVLAHGGPGLSHDYLRGLEALASETLRVVNYDQRGMGRSTGVPTSGDPIGEYAAELEALRRALGVEQISVLGHSAGGFNAIAYGSTHPERTASLILADSAAPTAKGLAAAFARQQARVAALQEEGILPNPMPQEPKEFLAALMPAYFADPRRPGLTDIVRSTSVDMAAGNAVTTALGAYDLTPQLSLLTMPVLNVICELPFGLEMAAEVADGIPPDNRRDLVLAGQSHFPWIECPDLFYPEVRAFLAEVTGTPAEPSPLPVA